MLSLVSVTTAAIKDSTLFGAFPFYNRGCLDGRSFLEWWGAKEVEYSEGQQRLALVAENSIDTNIEDRVNAIRKLGQVSPTNLK